MIARIEIHRPWKRYDTYRSSPLERQADAPATSDDRYHKREKNTPYSTMSSTDACIATFCLDVDGSKTVVDYPQLSPVDPVAV